MEERRYYRLQPYSGKDSRFSCPRCNGRHCFSRYIDSEGNIVDDSVGRCNHESSCGYHMTPAEFFRSGGTASSGRKTHPEVQETCIARDAGRTISSVDCDLLFNAQKRGSAFVDFLKGLIRDDTVVDRICKAYQIGGTYDRRVIFWQIDHDFRIRTGKIMDYDMVTGKRVRNSRGINWVHAAWKLSSPSNPFHLRQCLFGEHLLSLFPDHPVALVESEKTAILGYSLFPEYIWLATGGKSQTNPGKLQVLRGRRVILFSDVDAYQSWKELPGKMRFCYSVCSDILERHATQEERERKIDIGDIFINAYRNRNVQ